MSFKRLDTSQLQFSRRVAVYNTVRQIWNILYATKVLRYYKELLPKEKERVDALRNYIIQLREMDGLAEISA
jgi:hypothetical protein